MSVQLNRSFQRPTTERLSPLNCNTCSTKCQVLPKIVKISLQGILQDSLKDPSSLSSRGPGVAKESCSMLPLQSRDLMEKESSCIDTRPGITAIRLCHITCQKRGCYPLLCCFPSLVSGFTHFPRVH